MALLTGVDACVAWVRFVLRSHHGKELCCFLVGRICLPDLQQILGSIVRDRVVRCHHGCCFRTRGKKRACASPATILLSFTPLFCQNCASHCHIF